MRFFRRKPEDTVQPAQTAGSLTAEQEAELREVARDLIGPGFVERDHVEEAVGDYFTGTDGVDPRAAEAAAPRIVAEEWARREAELATTDGPSDYERLVAAFETLADQGVLGRMGFTCCQTCGTTEIDDERTPLEPALVDESTYPFQEWAYTFFHQQDAERLGAPGEPLYLSYSSFRPAADIDPALLDAAAAGDADAQRAVMLQTDLVVGGLVRDAIRAEGLDVVWDGTIEQRIRVEITDWRKPLPIG